MVGFVKIEWIRLLKNKKNLIVLGLFLALAVALPFYNQKLNDEAKLRRGAMYDASISYSEIERDLIAREYTDTLEGFDPETFDGIYPEENQTRQDYWTRDIALTQKQSLAFGREEWLEEAKATLEKDRNMKEGLELGVIRQRNSQTRDIRTLQELDNRIRLNGYLVEHGITPLKTEYEPTAYQYLFYFLNTVFPVALPIMVCLLCSDCFAAEVETGSVKSWLLMPMKRGKVYHAKLAAALLYVFFFAAVILGAGFVSAGLFHGFGAADYPVSVFYDTNHVNFPAAISEVTDATVDYLPVAKAIWRILLYDALFALFLTVLCVSLGSFIQQANTAITVLPLLFAFPTVLPLFADSADRGRLIGRIPFCYGYSYDMLKAYGKSELSNFAAVELAIVLLAFAVAGTAVKKKDWIC